MTDVGRYQCPACSKSFGSKQNLSRHGKIHKPERKHTCPICAKRFTRSDLLKRHARLHASEMTSAASQQTMGQYDTLSPVAQQPPSTAMNLSSIHIPEVSLPEWPTWDHEDLLCCDQIPEDILQDATSWHSFLDSGNPYVLPNWGINDGSQISEDATTHDIAREALLPSAALSPPNESSREDQTPFAWDPASRRISHIGEVIFDPNDPLLSHVEPRVTLDAEQYLRLKTVLSQDITTNGTTMIEGMPFVPSMEVLNAFLSQFVRCFLPQAPVLHYPTFKIHKCPDHLLMIMIAIGAVYTKRKHVRRFAIVLQDLARCHLHMAITANDVLLKDPDTVYSSALICYTGIWCGNKRAFEIAEALRGNVVAWARRLSNRTPEPESPLNSAQSVWLEWIRDETLKRLRWTVYMFDCQISSLMNTPPNMSQSEVFDWDCPCDDEYWAAPTARQCRLLLGNAVVPPSKSFAAALSPFLLYAPNLRPLKQLNEFGAFLVLLSINTRILRYAEERDMLVKISHMALEDIEHISNPGISPDYDAKERKTLARSLDLWEQAHGRPVQTDSRSGSFFQAASQAMIELSRLQMQISISDLQQIIGRSGRAGFVEARSRFTKWFATNAETTRCLVSICIRATEKYRCALIEAENQAVSPDEITSWTASTLSPYGPIYTFLAYVFLCACATAMTPVQKEQLYTSLSANSSLRTHELDLEPALTSLCGNDNDIAGKEILRSAAQTLGLFETWGCSTNLALLLHWRSRIN